MTNYSLYRDVYCKKGTGCCWDSNFVSNYSRYSEKTLLEEDPGRIDYLAQKQIDHTLPVVTILTRQESEVLAEKGFVSAKKAVFTEKIGEFPFEVEDLENTESVLFNMNVKSLTGDLIVMLNGEEVFQDAVGVGQIPAISLPKNMLSKQNVLELQVSSPGVAFWRTHALAADSLKVVADVTNVEAQTSKNTFFVSDTEKRNLESVELRFQPNCVFSSVGKLSIEVNGKEVYDAKPDCDVKMVPIEFSADLVVQGENDIVFHTDKGTYQLSHILIRSDLKEVDFPTYYFELSKEEFEAVESKSRRVRLTLDFVDVITDKRGDVIFNGHMRSFDTKELEYTLDLSEDVVKGNNALKIRPKKTLEVRELTVELLK